MAATKTAKKETWFAGIGPGEISAVLPGGAAIILLLAFVSYSPADLPSWVPFGSDSSELAPGSRNFLGPIGALVAGYGYFFFGAACYFIPAVLLWWSVQMLSNGRFLHSRNYIVFTLFILSAACLIEFQTILFQDWVALYNLPKSPGGFTGYFLGRKFLAGMMGPGLAFLLMTAIYLVTLIILTGIHPVRLWKLIRKRCQPKPVKPVRPRSRKMPQFEEPAPAPAPVRRETTPTIIDASQGRQKILSGAPPASSQTGEYQLPTLELLQEPKNDAGPTDKLALIEMQNVIVSTLQSFQVDVEPGDITKGPTITRYEILPAPGLRVSRIVSLKADIARATRAEKINILAPIPGKNTVGIEIANEEKVTVTLRELFENDAFDRADNQLPLALGKDVYGRTVVADLAKMPHLLVAGATGSGKSVCINTIIASLLYRFHPDELKFILIDPKVVEMRMYNTLPHMLVPVVTEPKLVIQALRRVIEEMERRYKMFADAGVRNFEGYRKYRDETGPETPENLPYIVVIIDELADLMQTAPADVETAIARIAQKARAAGIHLIVATQTPRADVVTGMIKANIPSRIAFQVSSKTDSRIILDENGAENLVGKGDMLYLPPGTAQLVRAQGALITDAETQKLVDFCSAQAEPGFADGSGDEFLAGSNDEPEENDISDADEAILEKCIDVILTEQRASTSLLQRRLRLGYTRAARMMDVLESRGIIGPADGSKPREILIDLS